MKAILIAIALSVGLFAETDFFNQKDKQEHIAVSTAISLTTALVANEYLHTSKLESALIGISTTLLIGIGKEYYDGRNPLAHEDIEDVYADTIGSLGGALLFYTYTYTF
jgi:uncharacterized protein YfiM (DUF2279 family)